ncbi:MAG: right-handed parallel beta-helix repeat-containing protein [Clostridia bacterium]
MNRCLEIHVSPEGNDGNDGGFSSPLGTIREALKMYYAKTRPEWMSQDKTGPGLVSTLSAYDSARIILRKGEYYLDKPISFHEGDHFPLEITAYGDEEVAFSGGIRIENLRKGKLDRKDVWYADIPFNHKFRQLFVNGRRAQRPLYPEDSTVDVQSVDDAKGNVLPGATWQTGTFYLKHKDKRVLAFYNFNDVEILIPHKWVYERMPIEWMDFQNNIIKSRHKSVQRVIQESSGCVFENVFEAFQKPGQWYHDTKKKILYYIPLAGESIGDADMVCPVREKLVVLSHASNKTFSKITFLYSSEKKDGITMEDGYFKRSFEPVLYATSPQAEIFLSGAVELEHCGHILFEGCVFTKLGQYGMRIGNGCRHVTVDRCTFHDLGGGGIHAFGSEDEQETTGYLRITNCHLHHLGIIYKASIGIIIRQGHDNLVAHNHIHDLYYSAVSCGWTWGYQPNACRNNIIEFNHIHDLGKGVLSDMGGIYTLGVQPGTIIRSNLIHDITDKNYGGWGIYLDEGSSHIVVENNICHRMNSNGFHQHYGSGNLITNNIFAMSNSAQCRITLSEKHRRVLLQRNIFAGAHPLIYTVTANPGVLESDLNLFWSYSVENGLVFEKFKSDYESGEKIPLDQWQASGNDKNTIVEDPLFADPGNGDFTLDPQSPALRIGFRAIDLSTVGIIPI